MNIKYVAETEEEFKELQKGFSYFSRNFVLKSDSNILWVEHTNPTVKTLERKFKDFNKHSKKGISIYTKENGIGGVFNTGDDLNYNIFWFNSNKEEFIIGLKREEEKGNDYLFEVKYSPKKN